MSITRQFSNCKSEIKRDQSSSPFPGFLLSAVGCCGQTGSFRDLGFLAKTITATSYPQPNHESLSREGNGTLDCQDGKGVGGNDEQRGWQRGRSSSWTPLSWLTCPKRVLPTPLVAGKLSGAVADGNVLAGSVNSAPLCLASSAVLRWGWSEIRGLLAFKNTNFSLKTDTVFSSSLFSMDSTWSCRIHMPLMKLH